MTSLQQPPAPWFLAAARPCHTTQLQQGLATPGAMSGLKLGGTNKFNVLCTNCHTLHNNRRKQLAHNFVTLMREMRDLWRPQLGLWCCKTGTALEQAPRRLQSTQVTTKRNKMHHCPEALHPTHMCTDRPLALWHCLQLASGTHTLARCMCLGGAHTPCTPTAHAS